MEFKTEHIGYLTDSIESTREAFALLGYRADAIVDDDTQQTRICFLRKAGDVTVELVEPYAENKTMQKMLKKGVSPYHTCFTVSDMDAACRYLEANGFAPLFAPVEAPAFGNRLICYFWRRETGLIEVVSER